MNAETSWRTGKLQLSWEHKDTDNKQDTILETNVTFRREYLPVFEV